MDADKSTYFDPETGRVLTCDDLIKLPAEQQKEIIKHWFQQQYEDPAESTPYESAEGGYIYIWGGPHDAEEVLWTEFGHCISEELLLRTAKELESECGVTEWASIPGPEDFDDISTESEFYPRFQKNVAALRTLAAQQMDPTVRTAFFALLYANAITILETYLSDVFRSLVLRHPSLLRKFVESDPVFKVQRTTLSELFKQIDSIPARVAKHLYVLPFHRLEKVQKMYQAVLAIGFPPGLTDILKAVQLRHDIVHRNGVTKEGTVMALSSADVEELLNRVEQFVDDVDIKVSELVDDMPPAGNPA